MGFGVSILCLLGTWTLRETLLPENRPFQKFSEDCLAKGQDYFKRDPVIMNLVESGSVVKNPEESEVLLIVGIFSG